MGEHEGMGRVEERSPAKYGWDGKRILSCGNYDGK